MTKVSLPPIIRVQSRETDITRHHKHRTGTTRAPQAQAHTDSQNIEGVIMSYFPRINTSTKMIEVVDNKDNVRYEVPENELDMVYKALGIAKKYPLTLTRVRNITFNDLQPLKNPDN